MDRIPRKAKKEFKKYLKWMAKAHDGLSACYKNSRGPADKGE